MSLSKRLRMRFRDSNGALISFTVNPPVTPVKETDVAGQMNLIISSNAFYTWTGGDITEAVDAVLYTVETEEIVVAGEEH